MNKIFILQNYLAKQLSGKLNYTDSEYWQKKKILGSELLEKTKDFNLSVDDFNSLTVDDVEKLGFCKWSEEFENLYLIPSYLWRFLPCGLEIRNLDNEIIKYNDFNCLDNDERFGCLAYGLEIK